MSDETVTMPDGRVIRDLTQEEYDKTYADGNPHGLPKDILDQYLEDAEDIGAKKNDA